MGKQHVKKWMLIGCEVNYELGSVEFWRPLEGFEDLNQFLGS